MCWNCQFAGLSTCCLPLEPHTAVLRVCAGFSCGALQWLAWSQQEAILVQLKIGHRALPASSRSALGTGYNPAGRPHSTIMLRAWVSLIRSGPEGSQRAYSLRLRPPDQWLSGSPFSQACQGGCRRAVDRPYAAGRAAVAPGLWLAFLLWMVGIDSDSTEMWGMSINSSAAPFTTCDCIWLGWAVARAASSTHLSYSRCQGTLGPVL